jgi:hypothetical protein
MPGLAKAFWQPNHFAGLVLDLDADNVAGNDGDAIGTWPNAAPTGSANDATQATGGNKPTLKKTSNGINSHNVLRFDGTTSYMSGSHALGSTGVTAFFVAKTGATTNLYGTVIHLSDNTTHGDWALCIGSGADTFQNGWGGPTANIGLGSNTRTTTTVYRGTAVYNKTNWALSGTWASGSVADTSFPTSNPTTYHVGVWFTSGAPGVAAVHLIGDIAKILVYNVILSTAQVTAVEQYLKTKYAIS